jgi:hypothetical protein
MNRGDYVPETRRGCQYVVENCGLEEPRPLLTLIGDWLNYVFLY